ncbi:hypothetical protein CXG81DRAFT_18385 [Caulochytrium protostelioides]|uniref:UNC93-like protein MFSD11 n=1 Tax=Caulochytrium protostelioides TaxID=1555241 RepID=A0A4P9X9B4_9FUNG|nr:hypothetical protein CXG81DRAFT_18385 [Caulochytrium protostelioides]|eukprot:RKP01886.1 hypothetical protein CXG81DRAFT_18385 [Caulochytrium protostelioides]
MPAFERLGCRLTRLVRSSSSRVVLLSVAFLCIFCAHSVFQGLAASYFSVETGFFNLAAIYLSLSFGNFLAPSLVQRMGTKFSMIVAAGAFSLWQLVYQNILDQRNAVQLGIMLPTSLFMGFGASVLWAGQSTYLRCVTSRATHGFLSGVFFFIFSLNSLLGNLSARLFLRQGVRPVTSLRIETAVGFIGIMLLTLLPVSDPHNEHLEIDDALDDAERVADYTQIPEDDARDGSAPADGHRADTCSPRASISSYGSDPPAPFADGDVASLSGPASLASSRASFRQPAGPAGILHILGRHIHLEWQGIMRYLIVFFIAGGFVQGFLVVIPLMLGDHRYLHVHRGANEHTSPDVKSDRLLILAVLGSAAAVGAYVTGRLVHRWNPKTLVNVYAAVQVAMFLVVGVTWPLARVRVNADPAVVGVAVGVKMATAAYQYDHAIVSSLAYALAIVTGYTDGAFITLSYAILGRIYSVAETPRAFATFKFWQSLATFVVFLISPRLIGRSQEPVDVRNWLVIIGALIGAACFALRQVTIPSDHIDPAVACLVIDEDGVTAPPSPSMHTMGASTTEATDGAIDAAVAFGDHRSKRSSLSSVGPPPALPARSGLP